MRKYYTLTELVDAQHAHVGPPGYHVPDFGKYIEDGRVGGGPRLTGRAKFSAGQTRHWIERGTLVMEELFASKVR